LAELPFLEKWRPESLEDLVGDSAVRALKAFVRTGAFPLAMIFYGEYGTGKTSATRAMVRDYYVLNGLFQPDVMFRDVRSGSRVMPGYEGLFPPVLYVDASVTRDIDTIRGLVQNFMRTLAPKGLKKFVIFDEADQMTYDAQRALRALIEKYPNTVTVYTANILSKIDPAIQDRAAGAVFEFKKPSTEELTLHLKKLTTREGVEIPDERLHQIALESTSVREAVGRLGTEVALIKAERVPIPRPAPVPVEVEKPVLAPPSEEEEKPIPEEPGPIDVQPTLIVDTYFKEENGKIDTRSPTDPHYFVTFTLPSQLAAPPWEDPKWQFGLVAIRDTNALDEYLAQREELYDQVEQMRMAFGEEWDAMREVLAENPPPFNKFSTFKLYWTPESVVWSPLAQKIHDIYHYEYAREELEGLNTQEVIVIARVKGAKGKNKAEAIEDILAKQAYKEEIEKPEEEVPILVPEKELPPPKFKVGDFIETGTVIGSGYVMKVEKSKPPFKLDWEYNIYTRSSVQFTQFENQLDKAKIATAEFPPPPWAPWLKPPEAELEKLVEEAVSELEGLGEAAVKELEEL